MTETTKETTEAGVTDQQTQEVNFSINKVYVKDVSFEAPYSPESFKMHLQQAPNIDIDVKHTMLQETVYEVDLCLTAKAEHEDKTIFIVEVTQTGIFSVQNLPAEQLDHMLKSFCPNILFPYAKELILSLLTKGGFPTLTIAPINFDALYMQAQTTKH